MKRTISADEVSNKFVKVTIETQEGGHQVLEGINTVALVLLDEKDETAHYAAAVTGQFSAPTLIMALKNVTNVIVKQLKEAGFDAGDVLELLAENTKHTIDSNYTQSDKLKAITDVMSEIIKNKQDETLN